MKRPSEIEKDVNAMSTLSELTNVFEGIASMRISQIKNQVLQATLFFQELWSIYSQLRVDAVFRFGRSQLEGEVSSKELYLIITAEGGFSGDIDQKLVQLMLETYDKDKNDIVVIGHHGALQLSQRNISFKKYFKLPSKDQNINVGPIVREVQQYRTTSVFYQEYVSLMVQDVRKIELSKAIVDEGNQINDKSVDVISEKNYIFEPSTYDVVDHFESSMVRIALSQLILESKLAQYASRFRAMSASHTKAEESKGEYKMQYNRSKRAIKDARLKEIINGMRKAGIGA
jgi:ATP synthase F1 gamma subunit